MDTVYALHTLLVCYIIVVLLLVLEVTQRCSIEQINLFQNLGKAVTVVQCK